MSLSQKTADKLYWKLIESIKDWFEFMVFFEDFEYSLCGQFLHPVGLQAFFMTLMLGESVGAEDICQMGLEVNAEIRALVLPFSSAMTMAAYLAWVHFIHL